MARGAAALARSARARRARRPRRRRARACPSRSRIRARSCTCAASAAAASRSETRERPASLWGDALRRARRTSSSGTTRGPSRRSTRAATGLDTGCVYGGRLTAMVLRAGETPPPPAPKRAADAGVGAGAARYVGASETPSLRRGRAARAAVTLPRHVPPPRRRLRVACGGRPRGRLPRRRCHRGRRRSRSRARARAPTRSSSAAARSSTTSSTRSRSRRSPPRWSARARATAEKIEIYRLLAYNFIILKRTDEADAAVRGVLVLDENFTLPPTESPRFRDFFAADARRSGWTRASPARSWAAPRPWSRSRSRCSTPRRRRCRRAPPIKLSGDARGSRQAACAACSSPTAPAPRGSSSPSRRRTRSGELPHADPRRSR